MTYKIPVRELTSHSAALRLAAEHVQHMHKSRCNIGCCSAFAELRSAVYEQYGIDSHSGPARKKFKAISDAQDQFREWMKGDTNPYAHQVYWMGPLDGKGQKRRITALLTAAEALA